MLIGRALVFLLLFCTTHAFAAARPNVVLITVDTARADRMGFLGSQQGLTPNLDSLAREGVIFTHAYSQVPLTTASHATILTGTYPQLHKVNDAGVALSTSLPYAPAIFHLHGYSTAAFVGSVILDPRAGTAPGFDRGFTVYDAGFHSRRPGEDRYSSLERRAGDVVGRASAWVRKHPQNPFFVWVHLYDPHAPYDPPEPFKTKYASDPYAGEIAYADSAIGELLKQLRSSRLYENSIIAVMSDHGESLGEHGERGHGIFLYDTTIHVPLLIKFPSGKFAGKHIDSKVELTDVLPTLLEAAAITPPKSIQGKSLLPLINTGATTDRIAYSETDYPRIEFGWSALRSMRRGKYLFVEAPRSELYDQTADPSAEHNLLPTSPAVGNTMKEALTRYRRQTASGASAGRARLTYEQTARLRALGYMSSDDAGLKQMTASASGADPKDKIEIANQMTEANLAIEEDHYQQAISGLQRVIQMDATFAPAYTQLGQLLSAAGQLAQAIPLLRKAVELRPESVAAHYALGTAFFQTGDLNNAAPQFEAAVAGNPTSAEMHYSLASIYVRVNRFADAKKQLQQSLRLKPNSYDANLMLGQILVRIDKQPAASLTYLEKAAKQRPAAPGPHASLAAAFEQLGRKKEAEQERALAQTSAK